MAKGKFAIVVNYLEDQNEPSRPDSVLVFVPDNPAERRTMLLREFKLHNEDCGDEDEDADDDEEITINETPDGCYGDIDVSYGGSHLFLTFISDPEEDLNQGGS